MPLVPLVERPGDVVHIPAAIGRRLGLRFETAERRPLRRRVLALGEIEIVAAAAASAPATPAATDEAVRLATAAAEAREIDPATVRLGQPVTVTVPALPLQSFHGSVAEVTVDAAAATTRVRATIPDPGRLLQASMRVELQIEGPASERLVVPSSAIIRVEDRRIALVGGAGDHIEPRALRTGLESDGLIEVMSGLAAGDRVVVTGTFLVAAESRLHAAGTLWSEPAAARPPPRLRVPGPDPRATNTSSPGVTPPAEGEPAAPPAPADGATATPDSNGGVR